MANIETVVTALGQAVLASPEVPTREDVLSLFEEPLQFTPADFFTVLGDSDVGATLAGEDSWFVVVATVQENTAIQDALLPYYVQLLSLRPPAEGQVPVVSAPGSTMAPSAEASLNASLPARFHLGAQSIMHAPEVNEAGLTVIRRIAVVNRGEAATRFLNTIRGETNVNGSPYEMVALYTDPDKGASFVRRADQSIYLGEPLWQNPDDPWERDENGDPIEGRPRMQSQYVNHERLYAAIEESGADAVWLGWGFVAEDAEFVAGLEMRGITVIGPGSDSMRLLGDKIQSKILAESVGVPVSPWSGGAVNNLEEALRIGAELGYPVVIKATAGGGGRGIRFVTSPDEMRENFEAARNEARKAFGNDVVFIESAIMNARHIEVQIWADQHGNVVAVGDRDCTIQRKNQKLIEMAPAPFLPDHVRQQMFEASESLARAAHYTNVGTVEFLYDPTTENFYFMEMNTRLQVEHTITEQVTGLDLVRGMIDSAAGRDLYISETPEPNGYALQARVNAEDPENGFMSAPGTVEHFESSSVPNVRTDRGIRSGDAITPFFDSNIAKVIGWGPTFGDAVSTLSNGLRSTVIIGSNGLRTTSSLALELLANEDVVTGNTTTQWLPQVYMPTRDLEAVKPNADVALLTAAALFFQEEQNQMSEDIFSLYGRGTPSSLPTYQGSFVDFSLFGQDYSIEVRETAPEEYLINVNGSWVPLRMESVAPDQYRVFYGNGSPNMVTSSRQRAGFDVTVNGVFYPVEQQEKGRINSPLPGAVIAVNVAAGDRVEAGQTLAVVEAMKMENRINAPEAGTIVEVSVRQGQAVEAGQLIVKIEPLSIEGGQVEATQGDAIVFAASSEQVVAQLLSPETSVRDAAADRIAADPHQYVPLLVDRIEQAMVGFDPQSIRGRDNLVTRGLDILSHLAVSADVDDIEFYTRQLTRVVEAYFDVEVLFQNNFVPPSTGVQPRPLDVPSFRDELEGHYLSRVSEAGEGLTPVFRDALARALTHYGESSLEPSDELNHSLVRMLRSHERVEDKQRVVMSALRLLRSLNQNELLNREDAELNRVLEGVVRLDLNSGQVPVVHAAAGLLYSIEYLGQSIGSFERDARDVAAGITTILAAESDEMRRTYMDALANAPHPAYSHLIQEQLTSDVARSHVAAELIFRRMYVRHNPFAQFEFVNFDVLTETGTVTTSEGTYKRENSEENQSFIYNGTSAEEGLAEARAHLEGQRREARAALPENSRTIEIILPFPKGFSRHNGTDLITQLGETIGQLPTDYGVRRVTFTFSGGEETPYHLTFRRDPERPRQFTEDANFRDIHSSLATQIELWRLRNFNLQRHTVDGDGLYLFEAWPNNERDTGRNHSLFAYAVVNEAHPSYDVDSRAVVDVPEASMQFRGAVNAVREAIVERQLSGQPPFKMNRITLYVRPEITISREEVTRLVQELTPESHGLGLAKTTIRILNWRETPDSELQDIVVTARNVGQTTVVEFSEPAGPPEGRIQPPTDVQRRRSTLQRWGLPYAYDLAQTMVQDTGNGPGVFYEMDLAYGNTVSEYAPNVSLPSLTLEEVSRPIGGNQAAVVVGRSVVRTGRFPEGMERMTILNEGSLGLAPLAEGECSRIIAALNYAEEHGLPVDWVTVSSGAKIAMDSGTENLDWTAAVVRRINEFTQAGGTINVVTPGIVVGAQSYWNATATMLMHTKGILIMTPDGTQILTGNQALRFSGSPAARDNVALGGFSDVAGPNGQAQYFASDMAEALTILRQHWNLTYHGEGELFPRVHTEDTADRDIMDVIVDGVRVGDILADERKTQPFSMRAVMSTIVNTDAPGGLNYTGPNMERWRFVEDGETAIVWETEISDGETGAGSPVMLLGIESQVTPRRQVGALAGPTEWLGGTLYPQSSKTVARALNAASGEMPAVVVANLSGFDGSQESLRNLQLEFGAEIGRAVVNFEGPIIFVVVVRYHGGAYVVFSKTLNEDMRVAATEGTYASVIGGAIAVKVIGGFQKEIQRRARAAEQLPENATRLAEASPEDAIRIREELFTEAETAFRLEYDATHTVERARDVGSIDAILPPEQLRAWIIDELARGKQSYVARRARQRQEREDAEAAQVFGRIGNGIASALGIDVMTLGEAWFNAAQNMEASATLTGMGTPDTRAVVAMADGDLVLTPSSNEPGEIPTEMILNPDLGIYLTEQGVPHSVHAVIAAAVGLAELSEIDFDEVARILRTNGHESAASSLTERFAEHIDPARRGGPHGRGGR